jgi:hypothetical protein
MSGPKTMEYRAKCKACGGRMRIYKKGEDGCTRYLECTNPACGRRVKAVVERGKGVPGSRLQVPDLGTHGAVGLGRGEEKRFRETALQNGERT